MAASKKAKRHYRKRASNSGKRKYRFSKKSGRKRGRNYSTWLPAYRNPSWVPAYAMNPGTGILKTVTAGFSPKLLAKSLPVIGGMFANSFLSGAISNRLPAILAVGPGSYVTGLLSAGLLGAGTKILLPRFAGDVFFGGIIQVVSRAIDEFVRPAASAAIETVKGMAGLGSGAHYSHYYPGNRITSGYQAPDPNYGVGEELETGNYLPDNPVSEGFLAPGLGDYLSRENAATARPLDPNSQAIEGTAATELVVSS